MNTTTKLQAFHNDPAIKQKYVDRMKAHIAADQLVQGTGWDRGKGCAVGCTLENYDHSRYPIELGLPEWLAYLEDKIFEGLSVEQAMAFPLRFLEAIPVGGDVSLVRPKLAVMRMDRLLELQEKQLKKKLPEGVVDCIQNTISAIREVKCYLLTEIDGTETELALESAVVAAELALESAARSAWSVVESVVESAVWSARSARSAWSARSARSVMWSAGSAVESAARSAESAESAESNSYTSEAENLLKLLSECK